MMRPTQSDRAGRIARGSRAVAVLVGLALPLAACDALDSLLNVEAPGRVPAANADSPEYAALLLNGAVGDFECALGSYVVVSGVLGEELTDATQTAARWSYDRRDVNSSDALYASAGCTSLGLYTPLSTARWAADNILKKLEGWTDEEVAAPGQPNRRTAMIATAAAYSGYSHLLLGEAFATGVLLDEELQPGGEVDRSALFERALVRFDRAMQAATQVSDASTLNLARVGKARALLNLGRTAEAGALAAEVPDGFVANATASTTASRRENRVVRQNNESQSVSVAPPYRNRTHMAVPDPRVPVEDLNDEASDKTKLFVQRKYADLSTPIPIASWREARLIEAEAALVDNRPQDAVGLINQLHDREGVNLPPFVSLDAAEIRAHLIEERRHELFLEGHHLGDIIRYDLSLTPAPGTEFATEGGFAKGGVYGADGQDLKLPLPDVERLNNPNISR